MFNHLVEGKARGGSENEYAEPNETGELHVSATGAWRILEWMPKKVKWREWPKRKGLLGYYLPHYEPRFTPEGARIHESALRRKEVISSYNPENLPEIFEVEHDPP
ncbi:hypothetical protein ACC713_20205 [Rhizobium johnstonii]|uniref:hypothetical protein n=1 Tax=Rhizobium johnstonii TaxID=3019933 RepID=UPI003F94F32D